METSFDLNAPLFVFSSDQGKTPFTVGDACEGISIMGGTGSGKSSGSGAFLARKFLSAGWGGVVLTVKPTEKDFWVNVCKQTGRTDDLLTIEPGCKYVFNFLDYEASRNEGSYTRNIVKLLKTVIQSANEKENGISDQGFWEKALDMLLFNVIELCLLAYGKLTVRDMYDLVISAPQKGRRKAPGEGPNSFDRAFKLALQNVSAQVDAWKIILSPQEQELIRKDPDHGERMTTDQVRAAARLKFVDQFFSETYRDLADKTRSIVFFSCSSFLSSLLQEPIHSLFCRHASTYTPEDCFKAKKVILLHLPVKLYYDAGRDIQCLFKLIFQRTAERRNAEQEDRPLFLFQDEAQFFLMETDPLFQATARSSRVCSVYITQNLSSYYSAMGGDSFRSQHKVKVLLGTLAAKFFHANADNDGTNKYASDLIGQGYTEDTSRDSSFSDSFSIGRSSSWVLEPIIRPEYFNYLRTGGPQHNFLVDAYVHRQGRTFANGLNFKKITFHQF